MRMRRPQRTARLRGAAARGVVLVTTLLALAATAGEGDTVEVTIAGYRFEPARLTLKAGTTVRWINRERRTSHSVYFTGEGAFESARLLPGESWSYRFDRTGARDYHCGPHPEMRGHTLATE